MDRKYLRMELLFYEKGQHCRKKPPFLNEKYRPHLVIKGQNEYLGIQFIHGEEIILGKTGYGTAECLYEGVDYGLLEENVSFFIMEGPNKVGEGKIIKRYDAYKI
jgi:hypothetical protein